MKINFNHRILNKKNICNCLIGIVPLLFILFLPYQSDLGFIIYVVAVISLIFNISYIIFEISKGFRVIRNNQYLDDVIWSLKDVEIYTNDIEDKLERSEVEYVKGVIITKIQEKVERVLNDKVSEYVYSKKNIEENFTVVLDLAVLSIKTNSDENLELKIKNFTSYTKRFYYMRFYRIDLNSIKKIVSKFDDILEYELN
ncbi:hypothetical protein C672_3527 [[Clostridium] bifermentans ATCC 638]|uniref:Uncharacterized protein n=1 Tax=Paraclostridium bifermentans ATCC 638 = DSM 14991 TaxID=1233171 RepID=T4VGX8_PARBF|nr:hypothetical protein [Paraclostridium bifermentans]EQK40016.1 hypothetical protein C672_3527 [[Clostridium] bifermentans ATCC 638] [Paraclostridium bifermentans ATCC 638 = DSM 14991]RIZ57403.1 hypothetical protein CHH45_16655 [Paraclostridium bifermentans]UAG19995.1 hypothetical protein KXZ80_17095 [Paraclostridium bifermentans]